MTHNFKVSPFGLKLIKAYEGFRPRLTVLVSGQQVIGYGHSFVGGQDKVISSETAEELLKADLVAFEALVNQNVFAPLGQNQFDALVSLAFNVGENAFMDSQTLRALNNGRPLDAASGFDEWRKSDIGGKVYVIDALVRRRSAEKALFLRPAQGIASAPRREVPPLRDEGFDHVDSENPVFYQDDVVGLVATAPYAAAPQVNHPQRRREDGQSRSLPLSEIAPPRQLDEASTQATDLDYSELPPLDLDQIEDQDTKQRPSPIAIAAAEVSARLDRLIDEPKDVKLRQNEDQPRIKKTEEAHLDLDARDITLASPRKDKPIISKEIVAANDGATSSYRRPALSNQAKTRGPAAFIQNEGKKPEMANDTERYGMYWLFLFLGATMLGGGVAKWFFNPNGLDKISAFVAPVASIIGTMLLMGTLYYLLKTMARHHAD